MLSHEEALFAKIAILNKLVTKDHLFKVFMEQRKSKPKRHIGVIMESQGFLTPEEVQRIMKTLTLVFAANDETLRKQRENEINIALAALREGYISTEAMASIIEELKSHAKDPETTLESILLARDLMTAAEINRLKDGFEKEIAIEGLTEDADLFEMQLNEESLVTETIGEPPIVLSDALTQEIPRNEVELAEMETIEMSPKDVLMDVPTDASTEAPTVEPTDAPARKPARRKPVEKWRVAVGNFLNVQKLLRAEKNRTEKQYLVMEELMRNISLLGKKMDLLRDNLRKKKMTEVKTETFQETLREIKRLENKIVRVLRSTRDRGRQSGKAAEKVKKSLHGAYAALKRR
jgi:hypothetical protein